MYKVVRSMHWLAKGRCEGSVSRLESNSGANVESVIIIVVLAGQIVNNIHNNNDIRAPTQLQLDSFLLER